MLSFGELIPISLLVAMMFCCSAKASPLEIQAFQPAVVPIRAITTLTLQTKGELNVTSNSSLQCRFKDISVPARMEDGFIFCDTPPMRNIDRVSVHLDVDGKLFKTKKPLYFHDPFKVSNITPSVVAPAQNVYLTVSGISCKEWIQYYVRFQTANGTKKTQQGICKDSVVTCYVPEFPPNTRLRVGLTLSNRLVEWADTKILIQYPIDAIESSVKEVKPDTTRKGAFTFMVVLKDRFRNFIRVFERKSTKHAKISVQYSPQEKPQSMRFLECSTTLRSNVAGDAYKLSCTGAEKEQIFFYPSINNVPLGGQDRYEVRTTLCPGKNTCEAEPEAFPLVLVLSCGGAALLVLLFAVILFVRHHRGRYQVEKKRREARKKETDELEMEVQLPENDLTEDTTLVNQLENAALDASKEEVAPGIATQENATDNAESVDRSSQLSGTIEEHVQGLQPNAYKKEGGLDIQTPEKEGIDSEHQSTKDIEMASLKEKEGGISSLIATLQSSVDTFSNLIATGGAKKCDEQENQTNDPQKQTLPLIKEMGEAIQEIERLCKQQESEAATQKMKETLKALRLACEELNSIGYCNMLPLIEELQENVATLERISEKEECAPLEKKETAF